MRFPIMLLTLLSFFVSASVQAQRAPRKVSPLGTGIPVKKSSRSTSTTTRTFAASIESIDSAAGTIRLKPFQPNTPGEIVNAQIGAATRLIQRNNSVKLSDFTVGEQVIAKISLKSVPGLGSAPLLRELWDGDSYAQNQKTRTEIFSGTVIRYLADAVEVRGGDNGLQQFRITTKTAVHKNGKAATFADFPVGAAIAIKPRSLPSGSIMAAAVAENAQSVTEAYDDTHNRWVGIVESKDNTSVTVRRDDNAVRRVVLAPTTSIKIGRRVAAIGEIAVGQKITVYLAKTTDPNAERQAERITVTVPRTSKKLLLTLPK